MEQNKQTSKQSANKLKDIE